MSKHLKAEHDRLLREIAAIRVTGPVAPSGVSIAQYNVRSGDNLYDYWKLVAKEPIFKGQTGKKTKTRHLGSRDSKEYCDAELSIQRRNAIAHLERQRLKVFELINEWAPCAKNFHSSR